MKTWTVRPGDIEKKWHIVDAQGKTLGRLATQVAMVLRGKHRPTYSPHADTGDHVIVINAKEVRATGNKEEKKVYYRHTGYVGGIKSVTLGRLRETYPERIIENAVRGMLPKNKLGRAIYRNLKVYADANHPHQAQNPQTLEV